MPDSPKGRLHVSSSFQSLFKLKKFPFLFKTKFHVHIRILDRNLIMEHGILHMVAIKASYIRTVVVSRTD